MALVRILLAIVIVVGIVTGTFMVAGGATVLSNLEFDFGGPATPAQGDKPGVVDPADSDTSVGSDYVTVTFTFECVADWCDLPAGQTLDFRIQQAGRSDFEWEGLYGAQVRDGDTVEVALFEARQYRLLVQRPNGFIVHLTDYNATVDAQVTLRLTAEAVE